LKQHGGGSNILDFPRTSPEAPTPTRSRTPSAKAREESVLTAEGLLLMHAFFEIASREDRQKVIALAERLRSPDDRTAKE
jgi:hypothetical protein